jgi:hypothetical protein
MPRRTASETAVRAPSAPRPRRAKAADARAPQAPRAPAVGAPPRARAAETPPRGGSPWSLRDPLLAHPGWLDWVRQAYAIDPGDHPFFAYVGLNFTAERLKNVKFYISFYRRLTEAELRTMLPVSDRGRFDRFYAEWQPTQQVKTLHRGVSFALKVDTDGTQTHYWHMRTKGMPFGPPERLAVHPSDLENYHGACEEFTGSRIHLKRYFYLKNPQTIAESLLAGGMRLRRVLPVDWLEYIESDGRDKFSWVTADLRLIGELVQERAGPGLAPVLDELVRATGTALYAPGSARGGEDHALYLFNPGPATHFDGLRAFVERYLGRTIEAPRGRVGSRPEVGRVGSRAAAGAR